MANVRENFHFHLPAANASQTLTLRMHGKDYPIIPHDLESRLNCQQEKAILASLPNYCLTHQCRGIEASDAQVHLARVFGDKDSHDIPKLIAAGLYNTRKGGLLSRKERFLTQQTVAHPKLERYGVMQPLQSAQANDWDWAADLDSHYGPEDTAAAIAFMHPELCNFNPKDATTILDDIAADSALSALADYIASGQPWNEIKLILDDDDKPIYLPDSDVPLHEYELTDTVINLLRKPVKEGLATTKANDMLKDTSWHPVAGSESLPAQPGRDLGEEPAFDGFQYTLTNHSPNAGCKVALKRLEREQLTITVTNSFLRFLSSFVRYMQPDGSGVSFEDWKKRALDRFHVPEEMTPDVIAAIFGNDQYLFQELVSTISTFMGIPLGSTSADITLEIPLDKTINQIQIHNGTLGFADWAEGDQWRTVYLGLGMTSFFNLVLPTYTLISTIGSSGSMQWKPFYEDKKFIIKVVFKIISFVNTLISSKEHKGQKLIKILGSLATMIVKRVLTDIYVATKLIASFGAIAGLEAIPFIGWGIKAALLAATAAELAQTTTEVIRSPMVIQTDIDLTMTVQVTLKPDPLNPAGFPATARNYTIVFQYSTGTFRRAKSINLSNPKVESLTNTFDELPIGGQLIVVVSFYSKEGHLVGKGSIGPVKNLPPDGKNRLELEFEIQEQLYPLTKKTQYQHDQKLTFSNGSYQWTKAEAPQETAADLNQAYGPHNLWNLNGITINGVEGILGYSWKATGQNIPLVGQTQIDNNKPIFGMHNISIGSNPNSGFMSNPQGYAQPPRLVYLRSPQITASDPHDIPLSSMHAFYYLDPTGDSENGYHLRQLEPVTDPRIPLTDSRRYFNVNQSLSWGAFPDVPDDLALHANGYMVAVFRRTQQLMLLQLPPNGSSDANARWATPVSGRGERAALVSYPVLATMSPDGLIYVLEAGNNRVQALDVQLNPVKVFSSGWSDTNLFKLYQESRDPDDISYLSMNVEVKGYIYILSMEGIGEEKDDYRLDIYTPDGKHLSRTRGVNAAAMTLDLWRNLFTLNYEVILGIQSRTQPSVSQWIPSTPKASPPRNVGPARQKSFAATYGQAYGWESTDGANSDDAQFRGTVEFQYHFKTDSPTPYDYKYMIIQRSSQWHLSQQGGDSAKFELYTTRSAPQQFAFKSKSAKRFVRIHNNQLVADARRFSGATLFYADSQHSSNNPFYLVTLDDVLQIEKRIQPAEFISGVGLKMGDDYELQIEIFPRDFGLSPFLYETMINDRYSGANLTGLGSPNTYFGEVDFGQCHFTDMDFSKCDFNQTRFRDCTFDSCKLDQSNFNATRFTGGAFKNQTLYSNDFDDTTFSETDFSGATLKYVTFKDAKFSKVNFSGVSLENCDFTGAELKQCDFTGASFKKTNMTGTTLSGSNFTGVDLSSTYASNPTPNIAGTREQYTEFKDARMPGFYLEGRDWSFCNLTGAKVDKLPQILSTADAPLKAIAASLGGLNFQGRVLIAADFSECDFAAADPDENTRARQLLKGKVQPANLANAFMPNCKLDNALLDGVKLNNAQLFNYEGFPGQGSAVGTSFNLADLSNTNCYGMDFSKAIMKGSTMGKAVLANAKFLEAILNSASIPESPVTSLHSADIRGTDFGSAASGQGANLDGADLKDAIVAKEPGTDKFNLPTAPGKTHEVTQHFKKTILGKTTHKTICPDGDFGPCSIE